MPCNDWLFWHRPEFGGSRASGAGEGSDRAIEGVGGCAARLPAEVRQQIEAQGLWDA